MTQERLVAKSQPTMWKFSRTLLCSVSIKVYLNVKGIFINFCCIWKYDVMVNYLGIYWYPEKKVMYIKEKTIRY